MILLRLISWPYFRRHVLRTSLTAAGIAIGVTVFVGMHTANRAVLAAFSRTVDQIAGKTELQIAAGDAGFDEEVLERVQAMDVVRVAVPVIEAVVDPRLPGQGSLLVLAIDMTGDRRLREYDLEDDDAEIEDPLIFLAQPDSLILSREFAERNGIRSGSRLTLGTAEGDRVFTVRGLMRSSGLASAFSGNLAVMDIYAAQKMFGRGRTFDRIDLALNPGTAIDEGQRELRARLGPAFDVQTPSGRGQQFESMLAGYSVMMSIASAFALFIGLFIIHNAFAIAVTQRRSEVGILRALGATRSQIRNLFLAEGAAMGLLGSAAGLMAGVLIARGVTGWIGGLIAHVYSVAQRTEAPAPDPWVVVAALSFGVGTSVLAAALPARDAARIDPVLALQKGRQQLLSGGESRLRTAAAIASACVAALCALLGSSRPAFYAGYAALLAAALLVGPVASLQLSRALRPILRWLRPVEGSLAADSLIQSPRRTSGSVIALMLSIALVVAFSGMGQASYGSILAWMNTTLDPDLFVMPTQRLDVQATRFPAEMESELAGVAGAARVQALRNTRVTFRESSVMLVSLDVASVAETAHLPPVEGDERAMYREAAAGRGVMVSDNLAQLQHLALGETVEIPAPHGQLRLPIVGIVVDYSDQQGAVIVDRKVFQSLWHDDTVNMFRVYVEPGASVADVRQRILDMYAGRRQVFALTNGELKRYILDIAGQWFSLTSIQVLIAALVSVLGIVNMLTVSITDRRRELGVLRAVGALHPQVKRTVRLEAVGVAVIGVALGGVLGAINLAYVLDMVRRDIAGMRLAYQFPWGTLAVLIPVMLATAFAAALWPARAAVQGRLVEALEYE